MDYTHFLSKMLTFYVLLSIGFISAKKKVIGTEFTASASKLLMDVFIVATIFHSVLGGRPQMEKNQLFSALLLLTLTEIIIYFVSGVISRTVYRKNSNAPQIEILLALVNALFVGLPFIQMACGSEGVLFLGLNTIPFFMILYSYGIFRLSGETKFSGSIKKIFTSPALLAALVALVIFWTDIRLPSYINDLCGTLSAVTTPLSLVIVGATMGKNNLSSFLKSANTWFLCFVRLIVIPLICYLVISQMTDNNNLLITCMIIAATPPGVQRDSPANRKR